MKTSKEKLPKNIPCINFAFGYNPLSELSIGAFVRNILHFMHTFRNVQKKGHNQNKGLHAFPFMFWFWGKHSIPL